MCVFYSFSSTGEPEEAKEQEKWPPLPAEFTEKYEEIRRIGKGAFGWVYKVRERQTRTIYATKQLTNNDSNKKEVSQSGCEPCNEPCYEPCQTRYDHEN